MSLAARDCAGGGSPKVDKVKKNGRKKRSNSVSDARDFDEVKVVVNEVLMHVSFHFAQCTVESIRVAVLNFYDPGSINEAKRILWESCVQHLPPYEARCNSPVGGSAHEKEVNDILLAIKDIDKKESAVMPKFVAQHLDKLPRVTPGEIDVVSLLERISIGLYRENAIAVRVIDRSAYDATSRVHANRQGKNLSYLRNGCCIYYLRPSGSAHL